MAVNPLYSDPSYVAGQIDSLRALILALSKQSGSSKQFLGESIEQLDKIKTSLLSAPVADKRLQAVLDCESWVRSAAESDE